MIEVELVCIAHQPDSVAASNCSHQVLHPLDGLSHDRQECLQNLLLSGQFLKERFELRQEFVRRHQTVLIALHELDQSGPVFYLSLPVVDTKRGKKPLRMKGDKNVPKIEEYGHCVFSSRFWMIVVGPTSTTA